MAAYFDDFQIASQRPASVLRNEKGDRRQTDYAPVEEANLLARSLRRGLK
jgi:hypothetical protein